ncbi:MAG TPA: YidC/Oxa1 family membrane protein insertase [Anaerolineae bacterium]|nr:YidC/Oxa1 family membrane protein insertase [Anaerolineae bacterium]
MSFLWNTLILDPMTNALLVLYSLLGDSFFLSIAVFTVATRLIMLPMNLRQQRNMVKMQDLQPQIREIQKKYRDNPQKMQEEFMKIGYNPAESLVGCLPLLLQMPIFIGLYRAIYLILGSTPQALFDLQHRVYESIDLSSLLPITNKFLWLNLAQPDPFLVLPLLVGGTMYISQKLLTPASTGNDEDNPMAAVSQQMLVMMPLMFGFAALSFPAGLSLYFILSNMIGMGQSYLVKRSRDKFLEEHEAEKALAKRQNGSEPAPSSADLKIEESEASDDNSNGNQNKSKSKRKRRRSKR